MTIRLHMHANFPYHLEKPNAAIGYLKAFLSKEPSLSITNVYWYLPSKEILEMISSLLNKLQNTSIERSDPLTLLTAYLSRFFYNNEKDKKMRYALPTAAESIIGSYTPLEEVNAMAEKLKDFVDRTIEEENMADVEIAGFTVKYYQWFISKYIWSTLKALNPNLKILAGGFDTKGEAEAFMEAFEEVDFALWGEGEIPLRELVSRFDDSQSIEEVARLCYRDRNGLHSTDISNGCDMVTLPFADHTDYFQRLKALDVDISPRIPILSSRSCLWRKCKFCNLNKGSDYYQRSPRDTVAEIEYQSEKYGIDRFIFLDTDIGRRNEREFEDLLVMLLHSVNRRKRLYDIVAEVSPIRLNRTHVQLMSNIRISVQMGFEALTDTLLKSMNKRHRFAENIQALKFAKDYGLSLFGLNVIRNTPGECEDDIIESIENLKYLRFLLRYYHLTLSELTLYKDTVYYAEIPPEEKEKRWIMNILYSEIKHLNLIKKNESDFFGFKAKNLNFSQLWDGLAELLQRFQTTNVSYSWIEFADGSSLIEEYNDVCAHKRYLLNDVETTILKFCDSVISFPQLKDMFPGMPEQDIEDSISQLEKEKLLYVDEKRENLISIVSIEDLRKAS